MELLLIVRVLLRRWWLVLIPTVIATALTLPALLGGSTATRQFTTLIRYSAAQQLDALPAARDGDYQDVWLASELTVNALTGWVTTSSFRAEVQQALAAQGQNLDLGGLGIAADNQRSIGQIFLSWSNPDELAQIAQAAITVLQTRSAAYFRQLGNAPAEVTILDEPQITPSPPPIADRLGPLLRIGLGLLAGVVLAFLVEYLDTTVRRREDVEALGLPVVATIPKP